MQLKQSRFLGNTQQYFEAEGYTLSLVKYKNKVSEEWHWHDKRHLSLVLQGGSLESRKKGDYQVTSGKVKLYEAGEVHRNRHTALPTTSLNLVFDDVFFKSNDLPPDMGAIAEDSLGEFSLAMIKIFHELQIGDAYSPAAIYQHLLDLFSDQPALSRSLPDWLEKTRKLLDDRWDEFVPSDEISKLFDVHPVTLSKYFRKHYGCTLTDYMRRVKLQKALQLLLGSKLSITEIAYACGFADHSHLIRVCKSYIGFNPKKFRKI